MNEVKIAIILELLSKFLNMDSEFYTYLCLAILFAYEILKCLNIYSIYSAYHYHIPLLFLRMSIYIYIYIHMCV